MATREREGQATQASAPSTSGPGVSVDQEPAPRPAGGKSGKRRVNRPLYNQNLTPVSELPEEEEAGGRADMFVNLLIPLKEHAGQWFEVVHYQTPTGAKNACDALQDTDDDGNPKRRVPNGQWSFEARKVANPDGEGQRHSKLYARFDSE